MLTFFLSIAISLMLDLQSENANQNLTIQVTGLASSEGQVRIAVYNSAKEFTKTPFQAKEIKIDGKQMVEVTFSLPEGTYAIAAYHDENENGKLDTNLVGIPKENYGFSNNARGSLGPPSFEDASISVGESAQTTQIELS
ncbi:MAG: DUF2141 domain-containing protein [Bacteroidota bacterium]